MESRVSRVFEESKQQALKQTRNQIASLNHQLKHLLYPTLIDPDYYRKTT